MNKNACSRIPLSTFRDYCGQKLASFEIIKHVAELKILQLERNL